MNEEGLPLKIELTEGTTADSQKALYLIEGQNASALLADRGYDTNEIVTFALEKGMRVVIPSNDTWWRILFGF